MTSNPAPAPVPTISTSHSTMLSADNPCYFICYQGFIGKITKDESIQANKAGSFKMVKGLAGDNTVSFESLEYPGYFLRHQNFQLKLQQAQGDDLFNQDASFKVVKGLGNSTMVSFESYNYPMHFISNNNFNLVIAQPGADIQTFKNNATFRPTVALYGFKSPTNPNPNSRTRGRCRN